jgi:uncharacterized protein YifN (PemK superfamily)
LKQRTWFPATVGLLDRDSFANEGSGRFAWKEARFEFFDMAISFTPRRASILMCDFGPDPNEPSTYPLQMPPLSVSPEMWKFRRVVVVSVDALNHRHGRAPGLCAVVPFSATAPGTMGRWDIFIPVGSYRSLTLNVWAKCAAILQVSHSRLDRPLAGRSYIAEQINPADFARIEGGMRAALGL